MKANPHLVQLLRFSLFTPKKDSNLITRGKEKTVVPITYPDRIVKVIQDRCEPLGWSRAEFTLRIIEKWLAEGAEGVAPADVAQLRLLTENGG